MMIGATRSLSCRQEQLPKRIPNLDFSRRNAKYGAVSAVPADGIDAASSNNGGLGMPPFCGQLSGAQLRLIPI